MRRFAEACRLTANGFAVAGRTGETMGGRFWLACIGCVVAVCFAGFLFFNLIGRAWVAFGALGAMIFAMCLIVGVAWIYDRAATRNR